MTTTDKVILIIEDEDSLRSALEEKLQLSGYGTMTASDGEDGLRMALDKKPDAILLDMMMPKMDGITMLQKLREDEWGKTAKVIVLTNVKDDPSKVADALDEDVTEYLVKSNVSLEEVVEKLKEKLHL